jgi:hypothetical protein
MLAMGSRARPLRQGSSTATQQRPVSGCFAAISRLRGPVLGPCSNAATSDQRVLGRWELATGPQSQAPAAAQLKSVASQRCWARDADCWAPAGMQQRSPTSQQCSPRDAAPRPRSNGGNDMAANTQQVRVGHESGARPLQQCSAAPADRPILGGRKLAATRPHATSPLVRCAAQRRHQNPPALLAHKVHRPQPQHGRPHRILQYLILQPAIPLERPLQHGCCALRAALLAAGCSHRSKCVRE